MGQLANPAKADIVVGRQARGKNVATEDPVDVLIIGAGASGAAVAWSLADTKMHIVCLEQGGKPRSGQVRLGPSRLGGTAQRPRPYQPERQTGAQRLSDQRG